MIYERKINYYETDRMGVVHHSNYIRFLEEARCNLLDRIDMPFDLLVTSYPIVILTPLYSLIDNLTKIVSP